MEGANSTTNWMVGYTKNLTLQVDNMSFKVHIHIVKHASFDILLGWPFEWTSLCQIEDLLSSEVEVSVCDPTNIMHRVYVPACPCIRCTVAVKTLSVVNHSSPSVTIYPTFFLVQGPPELVTLCIPNRLPVLKDQPPTIFPSAMPPDLISKQPLPMNPPFVEDLPPHADMPCPISIEPLPEPLILEPPVKPLIPIPWNTYQYQYLSMEDFIKHVMQNPASCPLDNQDSPILVVPPLEPEPAMHYLPDSPEGYTPSQLAS